MCNCKRCHLLAVARGDLTAWVKRHAHLRPDRLSAAQRRDFELLRQKVTKAAEEPCARQQQ